MKYSSSNNIEFFSFQQNIGKIFLFMLFLYPYSVQGLSANYLFVFFPIIYSFVVGTIYRPKDYILFAMLVFISIFIASIFFHESYNDILDRKLISFLIFMTMFSYVIIKYDNSIILSFKYAVVFISLFFILESIDKLMLLDSISFAAKDQIGSQRYGFVYIVAFWVVYFNGITTNVKLKVFILFILLSGIGLTFSRSSIVALGGAFLLMVNIAFFKWWWFPKKEKLKLFLSFLITLIFMAYFIYLFIPVVYEFFYVRLVEAFFNGTLANNLEKFNTSEGTRVRIIINVIDFISKNIFLGNGYLGIWTLNIETGSSHNQLLDILLRVGLIGFLIYLWLIYKLLGLFYRYEKGFFYGLVSILIYGLFHETFKESQGAFILAFFIGVLTSKYYIYRLKDKNAR